VRFESEEALQAWKTHPEHMKVQARGREAFFESYRMTVATSIIRELTSSKCKSRRQSCRHRLLAAPISR
jgi:hypothetical protein